MLNLEQLDALKKFCTPTICNAVEMFDAQPRNEGFMSSKVRCFFPGLGRMAGYAYTSMISADLPASGLRKLQRSEYWEATQSVPGPRIAVIQDLDDPAGLGSFWGEVNSNIHRALGFIGTVTNGSARDLDEMEALGFFVFASAPAVSHAYAHLVDCGGPVRVGGAVVRPGDLLHGDRHGVAIVPAQVAAEVAAAAQEVEEVERELIGYCKAPGFTIEGLKAAASRLEERFLEIARRRAGK